LEVRVIRSVRRLLFVAALAGAALAPAAARADAPTGRLLVLLHEPARAGPAAHASAARAVLARAGARRSGAEVPQIGLVTVRPAPGGSLGALTAALRRDPAVRSVQPEYRLELRAAPNDPTLTQPETAPGTPPGTPIEWAYQRQGLPHMWDVTHGDSAVVGVVDTGADAAHPELGGKINAAVDQGGGPGSADSVGHGTHVSSLACAATNDGQGMAGAGGNCRLVVERSDLTDSSIANGIVDATNRGAQAVNLSLGDAGGRPPVDAFVSAIDYAIAHGVVVVTAAADSAVTDQGQPASLVQPAGTGPDLTQNRGLSITSANFSDGPSGGGVGSQISMAAYGSFSSFGGSGGPRGIFAAFPIGPPGSAKLEQPYLESDGSVHFPCNCRVGSSSYAYLQGTSMASPQVAAVAAVIRSFNPDLSAADVVQLLKQSARQPGSSAHFWTATLGWGILDGASAVETARHIDRRPPSSKLRAPKLVRGTRFTLRWSGRDTAPPGLTPSGIGFFDVYASRDGHPYYRIARTSKQRMKFKGRRGSRYRFFTMATDRAGNREPRHRGADATTRIRR
jgi:subtilisin family serine protease